MLKASIWTYPAAALSELASWTWRIRKRRSGGMRIATRRKPNGWTAQLVQSAARAARDADRCAAAHRLPADPPVPAALHGARRQHAHRLSHYGCLLDRINDPAGRRHPSDGSPCFRRHRLDAIVSISHACAIAGLVLLGMALSGVAVVVFDAVVGPATAWIAGGCVLAAFVVLWFVVPLPLRRKTDSFLLGLTRVCEALTGGTPGPC